MTHQAKLNRILYILLDNHRKELDNQIIDNRLTFSFICNTVAEVSDDWEIEFIKQRLISDGYIDIFKSELIESPKITQPGIKFIQDGGYEQLQKNKDLEQKIKEETLKKFQFDKWAFFIAIISLITAIFSLFKQQT